MASAANNCRVCTPPSLLPFRPFSPSLSLLSSRSVEYVRLCTMIFHEILAYCEQEHLLPRETIFKNRLNINPLIRTTPTGTISITFADFMQTIIDYCPTAAVVGTQPQRILYERTPSGEIRTFICANFQKPKQRFSDAQMLEIYLSLQKESPPSWGGGRFGFARYFLNHGPEFLRGCRMGYLEELAQLLLNKNVLHCTSKGKIFVNLSVLAFVTATASATALSASRTSSPIEAADQSTATTACATATADTMEEFKDTKVHSLLHLLNLDHCVSIFNKEHVDLSILKEICEKQMTDVLSVLNVELQDQPRLIQAVNLLGGLI